MENEKKPVSVSSEDLIKDFEHAWLLFTGCSDEQFEEIKLQYIANLALKRVTTGSKDSYWVEYLFNTENARSLSPYATDALHNMRRRFQEAVWREQNISEGYHERWTS